MAHHTYAAPDKDARLPALGILLKVVPYLFPRGEPWILVRAGIAFLCLVLAKAIGLITPWFYAGAVDSLSVDGVAAIPLGLILAYGAARIGGYVFGELRDWVFERVAMRAERRIGLAVFRHLNTLSLRFHLDRRTGGLSRAIDRGVGAVQMMLNFLLFSILPTILEIVVVALLLWGLFDWRFAAVTLATVAAYLFWTFRITEWRTKFLRELNDTNDQVGTRALDALLNFETVKYFNNEEYEAGRFDSALTRMEDAAVAVRGSLAALNLGQSLVIAVGVTLVMLLAAEGIVAGTMSLGEFVLVNTYLLQLYQPLGMTGIVYRQMKQGLVDLERLFDLFAERPEITDPPGAPDLALAGAAVEFRDVRFAYDPRRPILDGVSFRVEPGQTVAIVGPTGAGKSTIGRLLFRFYDPQDGAVLIDGQNLRTVTQGSVRRAIGIVPQDTVLFNDTLGVNIAYGDPSAPPPRIAEAARLARLDAFIDGLPDGLETRVGERGLKLSGGEKQRVAIARAVLKGPPILLFDEATSALDSATESQIQDNLREVAEGRTTLVIAHRLSTVIDADRILVLDHGRIVESGRHQELIDAGGLYSQMWQHQREARAAGGDAAEAVAPAGKGREDVLVDAAS